MFNWQMSESEALYEDLVLSDKVYCYMCEKAIERKEVDPKSICREEWGAFKVSICHHCKDHTF